MTGDTGVERLVDGDDLTEWDELCLPPPYAGGGGGGP